MLDTAEQTSITSPSDSTQTSTALLSDAYKPSDNSTKSLTADTSKNDSSTADSLFGSLHFFDSSSDSQPTKAAAAADTTTAAANDSTAPATAAAAGDSSAAKPADSSSNSSSFLDKLSSIVNAGGASNDITQVTGKDKDGNSEVIGVGPIKVSTPDPFDWRHPIDSAGKFISHPIDTTEQKIQHDAEAIKDLYDRVTGSDKPAEVKNPYDSPEKQHLTELESKISDPAKKAQFEKDMADFEKRAGDAKPPMDPKEVAETYKQVGRLMEAKTSPLGLGDADRQTVAEQIMNHAAHPDRIDQGNHDTCAAAALESQIFTKDPSRAAQMIVDVTVQGNFVDKDLKGGPADTTGMAAKDAHNLDYPPADNERTMASQIFQTTAVKMIYPDYKQGTPGKNGPDDTGETIGNGDPFPGLTNDQVREMSRRITGKDNGDTIIANSKDKPENPNGGVFVGSTEDLNKQLEQMSKDHKLPAIINVDSRNEPFFGDSKGNVVGGSGGAHDVTIKEYIPGNPPKVVIENQWGKASEHTMTVDDLYHATLPPGDPQTIAALKEKVGSKMDDPSADPRLKLELLRQEHMATNPADKITDQQYQEQVAKVMVVAEKGWKQQAADGKLDEQQRRETWFKFDEMALGDKNQADVAGITRNIGLDLRGEDNDLKNQLIADQQKYSKEFIASVTTQKGAPTGG